MGDGAHRSWLPYVRAGESMKKEIRIGSLVTERGYPDVVGVVYAQSFYDPQYCRVKWADGSTTSRHDVSGVWSQVNRLEVVA